MKGEIRRVWWRSAVWDASCGELPRRRHASNATRGSIDYRSARRVPAWDAFGWIARWIPLPFRIPFGGVGPSQRRLVKCAAW